MHRCTIASVDFIFLPEAENEFAAEGICGKDGEYFMGISATMIQNLAHNGTGVRRKGGQDLDFQIVVTGQFHAPVVKDLGAVFDETKHLVVGNG